MKKTSNECVNMILKNGIVYVIYHKDNIDISDAELIVRDLLKFCQGRVYPHLFDICKVKKMSKEARDYFADAGNDLVSYGALVVNSLVSKLIANVYISFNKPKKPTLTFTNEDHAIDWLKNTY